MTGKYRRAWHRMKNGGRIRIMNNLLEILTGLKPAKKLVSAAILQLLYATGCRSASY